MAILLRILFAILQALPLLVSAYSMGVSDANSAKEGTLAASVSGLSMVPLNLLIYGGAAVFILGQVSGWSLKGFFSWVRGIVAWIVQSWKEAEPKPEPVVPTPAPVARTTWTAPTPVAPAPPAAT